MKLKELMVMLVVAVMCITTVAFAGNRPEFDAVGCDADNYFNDMIKDNVIENNIIDGKKINCYSNFVAEYFDATSGQEISDPCFPDYLSVLTIYWNTGTYTWNIVLQMKPESDIDLNIVDCVLKDNNDDIWENAQQTGRYRRSDGKRIFVKSANPKVTVTAYCGPYGVFGPPGYFIMDARRTPTLSRVAMKDKLYTSKALWEESIVLMMPETGKKNRLGLPMFDLHAGDMINIEIKIPQNNTCFVRYGEDNVIIKYIGVVPTTYTTAIPCCMDWPCGP